MIDITAIILAAGLSRRMGQQNKLLLPVNGVPMVRLMVGVYSAVTTRPVLVVTGHEAKEIEAALDGTCAEFVFNPDYAEGQATSVACGLRAAAHGIPLLVGLGDQPLLTADDLRALLAAHEGADPTRISIPVRDQQRGNPIVIPEALRTALLADRRSPGCKKFTRAHPEHVQFHKLAAAGFYTDVDTLQAYDAVLAHPVEEAL